MRKVADEKPASKRAKPAAELSIGVANSEFQSGPEPLHLLSSKAFNQSAPDEVSGLTESLWQPMIQATLEQVGQTLLDWCWKAFEQRFGEQLKHLNTARALSSQLLDPQLSLQAKCTTLLNVLETSTLTGGSITPYLDVARQLKTIFNGLQQPGSGVIKRGIDTLNYLLALLDLPAAQQIAGKGTLSPVRDLLSGILDWVQTLQRLSNVSWDSPQAIVDGLLQSGALPTWVTEIVAQGQILYETLSSRLTAIKHKAEQLQRLNGLLAQFNEATGTKAKFTALLTLLLDEDMLGLIEQYAPAAMGDGLKAFALFKNALQDGGEQDSTGLRTTLLSIEHVTSQPFIDRLGSEAGAVGQLMAEPLGNVRAVLRGSASQEAAFNLLLGLTDPKKTWTDFLLESSREMLLLPQVKDLGASFVSRFAWQAQAIKALYGVLDDTFWAHYKTAAWAELPALISDTALCDAQNKQSQLAIALSAASGIPGEHIQTVFTEVSKVCRSWGNDSWSEFLPQVTESVNSLLSVLIQHGQVLPTYVQTLLDIALWSAKGITRLLMLHAVWKAKADDEVLGEATLALIRKAIEEYAGENAAWAFDKAVIWMPLLAPLYRVLGNLEPIKEGQRVQWLANLLMRLYSLPEAQANKDIIWVREQIEAKAEHWLGGIPAAMLSNAIVEESRSKPGYDLTPLFTRAVQLQGMASYMSACFTSIANALQGADVINSIETLLNPARVHVPGRQRPAYLRDSSTFYAALPYSHPQQPLSTTTQNIAPIAWGAGAGATFLGGILFTYFAYKNYRKGNQTPSQAEAYSGIPLVLTGDVNADESQSTATQEDTLLEAKPYMSLSVPLKHKSSHWKKTGPLAAMSSVMFSASAYSLWKAHDAIANNTAREKVRELEALEADARDDVYAGQTNAFTNASTQLTGVVNENENENLTDTPPTTNTESIVHLERPQGDQSAPATGSAPTVNSDSVPLLMFFKPKSNTAFVFPELKEQERLEKKIQELEIINSTLQSTTNNNTAEIDRLMSLVNNAKYYQWYSPANKHKFDKHETDAENLAVTNAYLANKIKYNESEIRQHLGDIQKLDYIAADQREFVNLLSAYVSYFTEDLRLIALISKNESDIAILSARQTVVKKHLDSKLDNDSRMAPLLNVSLTNAIATIEALNNLYKGYLSENTKNMNLSYDTLMFKYDALSVDYEKQPGLSSETENAPALKLSGNDILSTNDLNGFNLNKEEKAANSYIGNVIIQVLTHEVGGTDAAKVKLNDQYTVHLQTTLNFSTGGMNGMSQPKSENKVYSLQSIALGEPYRQEETNMPSNKRVINVRPHNTATPQSVKNALTSGKIRNSVAQQFSDDFSLLRYNKAAQNKYSTFANQQASLVLLSNIKDTAESDTSRMSNLAIQGFLPPRPFKFKGNVLPSVMAYGTEDQLLLINYEARTSFIYKKNNKNEGMWEFISPLLSIFDKNATPAIDRISPRDISRKIGLIEITDYPDDTRISVGHTADLESHLWDAKIAQINSNFNNYVFTTEEQSAAKWIEITKSMLQLGEFAALISILGIATVPQTILGLLIGVGFGVAAEITERVNMAYTDQGDHYLTSQQAIETGRILMALGVIPEIGFGRKVLMKSGANSVEQVSKMFKQAVKATHDKLALLKMTPQQKSVLAARNGVSDAAFKQRVFPIDTNPEKAVINLQKETGEITPAMAESEGITPGTFLRGPTKEWQNPAELIKLPAGHRVTILGDNNTPIFSGLSLGDGKIAGINNILINPQRSNEWVVIDLTDPNILTVNRRHLTLTASQKKIKIVSEIETQHILPNSLDNGATNNNALNPSGKTKDSVGPQQKFETPVVRSIVNVIKNDPLTTSPFQYLLKVLESDASIKAAMDSPPTRLSLNLLSQIRTLIQRRDIGMQNVEYRVMHIWNEQAEQSINHIVLKAEKEGQPCFLDIFARRIGNLHIVNIDEPLILTESEWRQFYITRPHESLIIYQDFKYPRGASSSFNYPIKFTGQLKDDTDNIILTTPQWYKSLVSSNYVTDTLDLIVGLSQEQAVVLKAIVNTLTERSVSSTNITFDLLMTTPQTINTALQLKSVPRGHMVVLSNGDTHHHFMVSMGDGKFATLRLDSVDPSFPMFNGPVTSELLDKKMIDGKIGDFTITSGPINQQTLTLDAFLGSGSSITLESGNVLTIKILNQPDDKSPLSTFLDMSVLEHLWNARGVFFKLDTTVTGPVTYLVVSYVAEGEKSDVVQALSNYLKKEISHRNLRNNLITSYFPQTADAIETGLTYEIPGPYKDDQWRRKEVWESGIAFSIFEAMDTPGRIIFSGSGDQLLTLSAKNPIENDRWKLEWTINANAKQRPGTPSPSGTVPPLNGSVTGPMLHDVLKNISTLLPYIINNQNLEVSVYIGRENMLLTKTRIIDDRIISIDASLYNEKQRLAIKKQSSISDNSLNSIEPRLLPANFNTYLTAKQIAGHANKSMEILNFLLTLHAQFHSVTWPNPITRTAIENSFEALSTSQTIAQILTDLLVANSMSQPSPASEFQLSQAGISNFLRALMEQCYLDLNFWPDDTGLNRNTMAEKFDQHTSTLVETYHLNPEFAKWLTVIKYMDADIDDLLSRQQPTYEASFKSFRWVNGIRPVLTFDEVGSIPTYQDSNGHPSPLSRHQRARVRIMKNNEYIFHRTYEIPMHYRQPHDMTFYIAHAINLDMRDQDFDTADNVRLNISFAAGTLIESKDQDNNLKGSVVSVEKYSNIPIFSNINQVTNNPAVNYIAIVDFI